jgi:hypothetical protein
MATSANTANIVNRGIARSIFAGFTSSSPFPYSVISIVRLKNFQTPPRNPVCLPSCNGPFGIMDVERPPRSTTDFEVTAQ